ncbi:hypothetical protein LTR36_000987 [Oleoguttula mirabilis]|uniref:RNA polymerase-associated protein LEO1 n=1 Tax=Oleoguttula mirabilis TaxID=1507867 RepID=A0AAV9JPG7_9PEZI|nr:hypothetical protein LTR36_000987 [Oleoguttula mirabilis]
MASAAAVGANAALSPPHNDLGEDGGLPGEITSAIGSKEDGGLVEEGDIEENEDDDIRGTARRKGPVAAASVDDQDGEDDPLGKDLFGDDEDEEPARRQLDDEELDSGDDVDRTDRVGEEPATQEQEYDTQEKVMMDLEMARQPLPEPSDGEMYLLKIPDFMAIEPQAYTHTNFTPPTTDHHSNKAPSTAFSAYNTALTTVRWRHSPSDPSQLQSNARVLRWSDGSMTLQLASQPTVQYEIDANALAPPQRNPIKPTPVSVQTTSSKAGRQGDGTIPGEKYDQNKDAFTYMVVPSEATSTLRVTHKLTAGLSVKQSDSVTDDAIERLQAALANAANATKVNGASGTELRLIDEDPEKQRVEAEKAMRSIEKQNKKTEAALQRTQERSGRVTGRSGMSSGRFGGGLNASMLEDEEGMGGARPRKSGPTPKKRRQRQNSIYSEDEDFGRKRFATKEDEYDEEDDFLAPSDEEEAADDDEEDEDDGIVEEPRKERTPKRDRPAPAVESGVGDEADAEGEEDEDAPQARTKRRRIVDEDEDEE